MKKKRYITADEAIALLPEKEYIHTFYNTPPMLCGADWDKQEVIDKLKVADKIEIAGETARNMDHGLAVYNNDTKMQSEILFVETDSDKLNAFDDPDDATKPVKYTILSIPKSVTFECPHCKEEVKIDVKVLDFDVWDGGLVDCPECGKKVELRDWKYD